MIPIQTQDNRIIFDSIIFLRHCRFLFPDKSFLPLLPSIRNDESYETSQIPVLSLQHFILSLFSIFLLRTIIRIHFNHVLLFRRQRSYLPVFTFVIFPRFVREKNVKKYSYFLLVSRPNHVLSYRVSNQSFFLIRSIFVIISAYIYIYLVIRSGYKRINGVKTRFEPWSGHIGKCMEATQKDRYK